MKVFRSIATVDSSFGILLVSLFLEKLCTFSCSVSSPSHDERMTDLDSMNVESSRLGSMNNSWVLLLAVRLGRVVLDFDRYVYYFPLISE